MHPRTSLRALGGVLLFALLVGAQPAAAGPLDDPSGAGWFDSVGVWWGKLANRLSAGRALEQPMSASSTSEEEAGPEIDPGGVAAADEGAGEGDAGPEIDPLG